MLAQDKLLDSLVRLPRKKQLAFALLVFERMLPSLIAFSRETGRDASCYLRARDTAWAQLERREDPTAIRSLKEACVKNAPDTEEFSNKLTSYALNAALVMDDILGFAHDGNPDHITRIATLATDSVDLYLHTLNSSGPLSSDLDDKIATHPLMQQELRQQDSDIKFLSELPDRFDAEILATVRNRALTQDSLPPDAPGLPS